MSKPKKTSQSESASDDQKKRPITIEFVMGPEDPTNPTPTPAIPADATVKNDGRSRKKRLTFRF